MHIMCNLYLFDTAAICTLPAMPLSHLSTAQSPQSIFDSGLDTVLFRQLEIMHHPILYCHTDQIISTCAHSLTARHCHWPAGAGAFDWFNNGCAMCYHVCDNACKRSLAICHKRRALCAVSRLPSFIPCMCWTGRLIWYKQNAHV